MAVTTTLGASQAQAPTKKATSISSESSSSPPEPTISSPSMKSEASPSASTHIVTIQTESMKNTKKPGTSFLKSAKDVLEDVYEERIRQQGLHGQQDHPDSLYSLHGYAEKAEYYKKLNDERVKKGTLTWDVIFLEEVFEALSEPDLRKMREELIQCAAVATAWVESLDRRK